MPAERGWKRLCVSTEIVKKIFTKIKKIPCVSGRSGIPLEHDKRKQHNRNRLRHHPRNSRCSHASRDGHMEKPQERFSPHRAEEKHPRPSRDAECSLALSGKIYLCKIILNTYTHTMRNTIPLDDFLTTIQCDDFAGEWEEQQKILREYQYENWLDEQEKNYWENLAQRSEGFPCLN